MLKYLWYRNCIVHRHDAVTDSGFERTPALDDSADISCYGTISTFMKTNMCDIFGCSNIIISSEVTPTIKLVAHGSVSVDDQNVDLPYYKSM